jgi:hypothetical protein
MAVLTTFKIQGDPDELVAAKRERVDPIVEPIATANGRIEHITCKTDDGLLIVNVWETLEGSEKTAQEVRPKIEEEAAGEDVPRPTDWTSYEIADRVV